MKIFELYFLLSSKKNARASNPNPPPPIKLSSMTDTYYKNTEWLPSVKSEDKQIKKILFKKSKKKTIYQI